MDKEIWIRADKPEDKEKRKELVLSALESGIGTALVRPGDEDFSSLGKVKLYFNDNGDISENYEIVALRTPEDQDRAMAMAGKKAGVILDSSDWTVIPLENLIARFRDSGTKVYACAADTEQAKLYMQTLEKGVDGIVISTADPNKIRGFTDVISSSGDVDLQVLDVVDVRNIEMGDRVCVDTVSMMVPGEGMLIGSSASCMAEASMALRCLFSCCFFSARSISVLVWPILSKRICESISNFTLLAWTYTDLFTASGIRAMVSAMSFMSSAFLSGSSPAWPRRMSDLKLMKSCSCPLIKDLTSSRVCLWEKESGSSPSGRSTTFTLRSSFSTSPIPRSAAWIPAESPS